MRVLLLKNVPGIGQSGTIVVVQPGYARNFLLPRKLASAVTAEVLARVQREQQRDEHHRQERQSADRALVAAIDGKSVAVRERAEGQRLFGSVTSAMLVTAVRKQLGAHLRPDHLKLLEPLKTIGEHKVSVQVGEAKGTLSVNITAHA